MIATPRIGGLLLLLPLLVGCTGSHKPDAEKTGMSLLQGHRIAELRIMPAEVPPERQRMFSVAARELESALRQGLEKHALMQAGGDRQLLVRIRRIRLRSNLGAIVLWPVAGSDEVHMHVWLLDREGTPLHEYDVRGYNDQGGTVAGIGTFRRLQLVVRQAGHQVIEALR